MDASAGFTVTDWDASQRAVIGAGETRRLIVDAGPGTGKTAVACARLNYLVSECDVQPSRTWMISFTRTAVAEIRARLYAYLGQDAAAVRIATLDSHAWSIHSGFEANAKLTGTYEANIEHVLELVRSSDEVAEHLDDAEHVIVDEAQDLVGIRADLVEAIITKLRPSCGVTVFADAAQAIYGFSEDEKLEIDSADKPLLERIGPGSSLKFESIALDTIHRTKSPGLISIFSGVRSTVLGKGSGLFGKVREAIEKHASANDVDVKSLGLETLARGSLVLFRSRAEALIASQFCTVPHSLRLSGFGVSLPPWLAICFHDFTVSHMGKDEFVRRWLSRVENSCPPDYCAEEAWRLLTRFGGAADGSLEMIRLRRRLGRTAPPVELATREFGLPGPIIGTIHASKGREADDVILLLPEESEFENTADEEEESRVLFVGSTRARQSLRVGKAAGTNNFGSKGQRAYRGIAAKGKDGSPSAMIEIGRGEDISATGLVGTASLSLEECTAAQAWLIDHACRLAPLKLQLSASHGWKYQVVEPETSAPLGLLSNAFVNDMWDIAKTMGAWGKGRKLNIPYSIRYVRSFGARTMVLPPDDPQLENLHAPWQQSGFILAPRIAAYTKGFFNVAGA
ncbi:UvrD-helicase domain-containing protein [Ochrobactrum sp. RH2CCR150]|uniref:UvrD-helicase domain-containing protein n=1 Tax=Ochrobactrum sp. RH2CCR150 TaxID=2587044 RepID=UPI0015FC4F31|nr:SAM-dependent methyltransferase [Ochrobactrum sp. RH2CCR150]